MIQKLYELLSQVLVKIGFWLRPEYELWYLNRRDQWVFHGDFSTEAEAYEFAKKKNMEFSKVLRKP
jgi:hypothetical protein